MESRNIYESGYWRVVLKKVIYERSKSSQNASFITFTLQRDYFTHLFFRWFQIVNRINFKYFLTENNMTLIILRQNDIKA